MKLNIKNTFLVGIAFCGIMLFWSMFTFVVPKLLSGFGVSSGKTGFVLSLESIAGLLLLPLFGAWSDKVNTRIGKRMPFVIIGTILAVIGLCFIPLAISVDSLNFFYVLIVFMVLAMCSFRSPAVALMPTVTPKPLRSQANSIINLTGAIGTISFLIMPKLFEKNEVTNYTAIIYVVAALMIILLVALVLTVNEPKLTALAQRQVEESKIIDDEEVAMQTKLPKDKFKSFVLIIISIFFLTIANNVLTKWYSLYSTNTLGMSDGDAALTLMFAQGAALIAFIPVGLLSQKLGRRKVIMFGLALLSVVYSSLFLVGAGTNIIILALIFALAGLGQATIIVNTLVLIMEISRGVTVGKYTGFYYTATMSAGIVATYPVGKLIEYMGKLNNIKNSDNVFADYTVIIPIAVVCAVIAFATMLFVKHGEAKKIDNNQPLLPTAE